MGDPGPFLVGPTVDPSQRAECPGEGLGAQGQGRNALLLQPDGCEQTARAASASITDGDESDVILRRLATSHRDSIGVIGRLTTPLSPAVAAMPAFEPLRSSTTPIGMLVKEELVDAAGEAVPPHAATRPTRAAPVIQ